ncbi:CidA/LrgA family protein [Vibrio sp. S4M6]|uniref:CidA/LrgA family protein n=1 Tax=Vibrio sinus TaxID=2946865 RepID=UPI00202A85A0|nr:CidA/LrgA family protein [Vibrio sinus]MCL9783429.1 CidA/LrgA family protein [Vibrio sinus]
MFKKISHYLISIALIYLCLFIGKYIQSLLGVSIPGSIFGMLLLFALLAVNAIPIRWVQPGASLFIRYMVFLFVPISVGLMQHFDVLIDSALPILASTVGGTLIVLVTLSIGLDRYLKKGAK